MAIMIHETQEKDFVDYMEEALDLLKDEGLDNPSLSEIIETHWIEPFKEFGELAHQMSPVDLSLIDYFCDVLEGEKLDRDEIVIQLFRPYLGSGYVPGVKYKLFYNTVTQEFTTQGKPLETILLYEEDDFSLPNQGTRQLVLGKAVYQYMLDLTEETEMNVKKEVISRMRRRINSALKRQMIEEINSETIDMDTIDQFTRGEILSINPFPDEFPLNFFEYFLAHYYDLYTDELGHTDDLMNDRLLDVVQWSKGDFSFIANVIYISSPPSYTTQRPEVPSELLVRLVEVFIDVWGVDDVANHVLYQSDEVYGLSFEPFARIQQAGVSILLTALPDAIYEEGLRKTIQCLSNRTVDFYISPDVTRLEWMDILNIFLEDERSYDLLDQWGGLHSSRLICGGKLVRYNQDYQVTHFLQPKDHSPYEDLILFSSETPDFDYVTYIDDEVYEEVTELINRFDGLSFGKLPIDSQQRVWKREYARLRPVSELRKQIEGLPFTLDDFSYERFIYVPAISQDGLVSLIEGM